MKALLKKQSLKRDEESC